MLSSVKFGNYRVLQNAQLQLADCTLLLGPNGSGKSTVLRGLSTLKRRSDHNFSEYLENLSVGLTPNSEVEISARFVFAEGKASAEFKDGKSGSNLVRAADPLSPPAAARHLNEMMATCLSGIRVYSLDANAIAKPVTLQPSAEIAHDGANLSVVLTQLQDQYPERFESLNGELQAWFPEFDRVLFDTPAPGQRGFSLRSASQKRPIKAADLSQGTLLAMCILTLANLPEPPSLICLEEPDRGIHPRLLRQIHDAMVRLSNPQSVGDTRKPVQVIATTHSPYFLDTFRDHPEDVVLAEKGRNGASFHRLIDMDHYKEIMSDSALGDAWYSGILGGVPVAS